MKPKAHALAAAFWLAITVALCVVQGLAARAHATWVVMVLSILVASAAILSGAVAGIGWVLDRHSDRRDS